MELCQNVNGFSWTVVQTFIVMPNKYQKRMLMHLTTRISKMQYYMSLLLLLILTKMYYLGHVLRMWWR